MFTLKPLGALNTVMFSQARKIFYCFSSFELMKVFWRFKVSMDEIEIPDSQMSFILFKD